MSADTRDLPDGPEMDRRTLLKTVGTTAGAAATVGGAGQFGLDPVGDAEAVAFTTAAVATSAAFVAGMAIVSIASGGDDTELDPEDVLEDQIYSAASSVSEGRDAFVDEMTANFVDPNANQTPYANAAWGEIRAAVAETVANGGSVSDSESAAVEALDLQTTRSIINVLERYNSAINSLVEEMVVEVEESVGSLGYSSASSLHAAPSSDWGGFSTVGASEVSSGGYVVGEFDLSGRLPASIEDVNADLPDGEKRDPPFVYAIGATDAAFKPAHLADLPDSGTPWIPDSQATNSSYTSGSLTASHSSLSNIDVMDVGLYSNILGKIRTEYDSISSDLSTYVTNLHQSIEEGDIEPSDVFSPSDVYQEFASSDGQSRMAGELLAIGAEMPQDVGMEVLVSHPDLQSDELWGQLYPRFSVSEPPEITPGSTISSSDYSMAYFGFNSAVDDEWVTRILSGDSDLEIHDVAGLSDTQTIEEDQVPESAGSDTSVVIWQGEDPPEPIEFPADHSEWSVVIEGAATTSSHPVGDVVYDSESDEYSLPSTGLSAGEAIEGARLLPPTGYNSRIEPVSDASSVDGEAATAQIEAVRDTVSDLKEELNSGGGGGGVFDDLLGSLGNLGQLAAAGVIALFVILIAVLASFASYGDPEG